MGKLNRAYPHYFLMFREGVCHAIRPYILLLHPQHVMRPLSRRITIGHLKAIVTVPVIAVMEHCVFRAVLSLSLVSKLGTGLSVLHLVDIFQKDTTSGQVLLIGLREFCSISRYGPYCGRLQHASERVWKLRNPNLSRCRLSNFNVGPEGATGQPNIFN